MKPLSFIFNALKKYQIISLAILIPFYFIRFVYYSIRNRSLWFYRYYPGHYGSTIPSGEYINQHKNSLFISTEAHFDGVNLNENMQKLLSSEFEAYYDDFHPPKNKSNNHLYYFNNGMFEFGDGFILFCFLNHFRPKNIIEIGSGFSSALMLDTVSEILSDTFLTFIDPYSTTIETVLADLDSNNFELIKKEVQQIPLTKYAKLGENDILFIDSSHVIKIGSDLSTILFSILPSLRKGVIIHFHDIYYPFEYPEDMLKEGRAWNENYVMHAFLQFNSSFEVLYFNSYLRRGRLSDINQKISGRLASSGNSLWLRKTN